jgi:hypothetical protein
MNSSAADPGDPVMRLLPADARRLRKQGASYARSCRGPHEVNFCPDLQPFPLAQYLMMASQC